MAPEGLSGFDTPDDDAAMASPVAGPSVILHVAQRMVEASCAHAEGIPSYGTRSWLVGLTRRSAFRDAETGAPADPDLLLAGLLALRQTTRSEIVADLLEGTLRSFPLSREDARASGHDRLFLTALVLLLAPQPPTEIEVRSLMQGFDAVAGRVDRRSAEGLGLRFLTLAMELAIGLRCDGPVTLLARQLHDLGQMAGRGAGAMLLALDAAEQREERVRAALSDPAFAMRMHVRVPRRAMTAADAESVRKDFALNDPLADRARLTLEEAGAEVAALRKDIATLNALEQMLKAEAAAVLTRR